ncbi:MAG: hypothetical protein HXY34_01815 [Candidatus Thorarchaeota archaeon]|nr:hypothetical protein [Candidatus Thorarchaeota archaeon]
MNESPIGAPVTLHEMVFRKALPCRVLRVDCSLFPTDTYILESQSALRILLEPWLVGGSLAVLARQSSVDFLRVAYETCEVFRDSKVETITEVVPMAGALYYGLAEAFESVFGETPNRCFVGARRRHTPTGWATELAYKNFEAMPSSPLVLIGDTIATGGTIEKIISVTLERAPDTRAILVYSIAGGVTGVIRLRRVRERTGVPICVFLSNAVFGVDSNGTDMPWLHPATIVTPENRAKAVSSYGSDLGRRWCSVWDWGERAKQPTKHLRDLIRRCDMELNTCTDDRTRRVVGHIREQAVQALGNWSGLLALRR